MTAPIPSIYAHLLEVLERSDASACVELNEQLPPNIASLILSADEPTRGAAAASLASLLKARIAVMQAAFDTRLVADELLKRPRTFESSGSRGV